MTERASDLDRSYAKILAASERVNWTVDEVLDKRPCFDVSRAFLPESLVRAAGMDYVRVLKFHYVEEVQHAKIDELVIDAVAATCSADEIADAIEQHQDNCDRMDTVLGQQAQRDASCG